ncbi:MAG: hypothetical protein IE914_10260 [Thiotrichales bacterium]|nr:hypothetical protein [Thiotrichales bacterium]
MMGLPAYNKLLPYVKAGLGYESQSKWYYVMLIDAGVGAKYPISENMALKAEWLYFLKDNSEVVFGWALVCIRSNSESSASTGS